MENKGAEEQRGARRTLSRGGAWPRERVSLPIATGPTEFAQSPAYDTSESLECIVARACARAG